MSAASDHFRNLVDCFIAPPVAAGSVDTIRTMIGTYRHLPKIHSDEAWAARQAHMDAIMNSIAAWGAQQREAGRQGEAARILHLMHERDMALATTRAYAERAEKAEACVAEMEEKLRNHNGVRFGDPLPEVKVSGCVFNTDVKDQHPNAIDPSDTPC